MIARLASVRRAFAEYDQIGPGTAAATATTLCPPGRGSHRAALLLTHVQRHGPL